MIYMLLYMDSEERVRQQQDSQPHRAVINMTSMKVKSKRKPEPKSDISGTFNRVAEDLELFASVWSPKRKAQWRTRKGKPLATPVINMTAERKRKVKATFNQKMATGKTEAAMKLADKHFELCFKPVAVREHRPHEKDLPPPPVREAPVLVVPIEHGQVFPELNPVQREAAAAECMAANAARRKAKELMAAGKIKQWMNFVSRNPISLS